MAEAVPDPNAPRLVYDGTCGLCVGTMERLVRRGIVEPRHCRALQAFDGEEARALREAGIADELVVVAPDGALVPGVAGLGLLYAYAGRARSGAFLSRPPTRGLATVAYRLVARNRRVLSPVPARVRAACDCDPAPHVGYRLAFVLVALAVAGGVASGLGALLAVGAGAGAGRGARLGLAAAGLLAAPLLLAPLAPRGRRSEAAAHAALQAVLAVGAGGVGAGLVLLWALHARVLLTLVHLATHATVLVRVHDAVMDAVWPVAAAVSALSAVATCARGIVRRIPTLKAAS